MTNFFVRQLQEVLIHRARGGIKAITTIQSEKALTWVIGFIVYVLMLILSASVSGRIPGLYHVLIIYPLATYGVMSALDKLAKWSEEDETVLPR
jgi:hypothetical protein